MKPITAFAIAALVTGCVSAKVTRLVPTVYEPISPEQVTVLVDIRELLADTIRYERLAVINLSGDGGGMTDQTDLLNKAREEAAKLGANAIIIGGYSQGDAMGYTPNEGSAIAIRYEVVRDTILTVPETTTRNRWAAPSRRGLWPVKSVSSCVPWSLNARGPVGRAT